MSEMVRLLNILAVAYENPKPLNMSEEDKKAYMDASSNTCHICEETFKQNDVIIIDHDHVNFRISQIIPQLKKNLKKHIRRSRLSY